jgi:hypothetical protein
VLVPWVTVDWEHNEVVIATSIAVRGAETVLIDTIVEIRGSRAGYVTTRATNTTSARNPVENETIITCGSKGYRVRMGGHYLMSVGTR